MIEHWHLHVSFSVVARFISLVAIDTNNIYFSPLFKYNIWSSETAVSVITQMFSHLWLFLKTILFGTPLVMSLLVYPCKVLCILPSARKWFYSISWQSHNHRFINSPKHLETGTSETRNQNSHVFDLKKKIKVRLTTLQRKTKPYTCNLISKTSLYSQGSHSTLI